MTRIGPTAAARTRKCGQVWPSVAKCGCRRAANTEAIHRTRRAMCAACNGNRPKCQRSGRHVAVHIKGEPCPRGWHPDARGRVRWAGLTWTGVPFPVRLYLYLRKPDADPETWVDSFAGCGCVRALKAAWLRLKRHFR